MKFSTKATYGLRAIVNLASSPKKQKTLKAISLEENISQKYLEKIFSLLKGSELIVGTKGMRGGYVLARDPEEITAQEIIETLDGPIVSTRCINSDCPHSNCCTSSQVWITLESEISNTLNDIKLSDLIKKEILTSHRRNANAPQDDNKKHE